MLHNINFLAIPYGHVSARVVGACFGRFRDHAFVVEEDFGPVTPVGCHLLVVDVGGGGFGILAASGRIEREKPVDAIHRGLLDVGGAKSVAMIRRGIGKSSVESARVWPTHTAAATARTAAPTTTASFVKLAPKVTGRKLV